MNEQQTKDTTQPSGFKLYAIIVAAILTCVAVICALLISFTIYEARRGAAIAEDNALEAHAQAVSSLADDVDRAARRSDGSAAAGSDLYLDYSRLPHDATNKQRKAKLNEIEAKLTQLQKKYAADQLLYETLPQRVDVMNTVGLNLRYGSPAYELYHEWRKSPYSLGRGTLKEQLASLDELERKIKTLEPSLASYFPYAAEAATDAGQ